MGRSRTSASNVAALTLSGQDKAATQVILNRIVDEQDGIQSVMLVDANGGNLKILEPEKTGAKFGMRFPIYEQASL